MARGPRMFREGDIYFITTRTIHRRFLLRPDPYVNDIIGGVLAKGVEKFDIALYGHTWLSNHPHLIARARQQPERLSDFMGWIKSNIAIKLGGHVDWRGPFWERRFTASPILDDETLIERLQYLLAHSVKEQLVESPFEWPGVHCAAQLAHGTKQVYNWHDWTSRSRAQRRVESVDDGEFKTPCTIELEPLPCWSDLDLEEQQRRVRSLIDEVVEEAEQERRASGKRVLGIKAILAQRPHDMPTSEPNRTPHPMCHTASRIAREEYRAEYQSFCADYTLASEAYRAGDLTIPFPHGAFRPFLRPLQVERRTRAPPDRPTP